MSEDDLHRDSHPKRPLLRIIAILAAAVALYAMVGFFAVPPLVRWAVQTKGCEALHRRVTLGEVAFNPFTLRGQARNLDVRDRDGQPLFSLGALEVKLAPSGTLKRAWRLSDLTVDKPALQVRFLRDGKLSFADLFDEKNESKSPTRLIIDHLAIRGGKLDFADESAAPPLRTSFTPLNAEVRDLITIPGEKGEHALSIGFDRGSTIRITGRQVLEPLSISGRIEIRHVDLASNAQRFAPDAPLLLRSGEADAALDYEVRKQPTGVQVSATKGELTATNLALLSRSDNVQLLAAPRIEVRDAGMAFPARRVEIGSIRVIEPVSAIGWNPQGRFNWSSPATAAPASAKKEEPKPASAPWTVKIAKAAVERGTLHFDDQQTQTPVRFDLTALNLDATGVSNDTKAPVAVAANANAGANGKLSLRGTLVPSPFNLDLQTSLNAIDLLPFQPYTASIKGMTLAAGSADFNGRMLFSSAQPFLIEGDGAANGIEFVDAATNRLLGCKTAALRQMTIDGAASRYRIRRIDLDGGYANVVIDKQRNINLAAIGGPAEEKAEPKKGSFDIGTINVADTTIDYRDDSLVLPFATAITSTKGTITDFSTTSAAPGSIRLDGNVAEHGAMAAQGTLRMADPFAGTDLSVQFRSVPMPVLTPYAAEFAGYEIVKGALDLDLHYRIANRRLIGDHKVVASDLTLGKKVGGSKAGLAVRLAIALLKDHDGKINLEVPIEGTVDDPQFNYRSVMWQAVKTILGNVVKAPFRALGHAMGFGGENLQVVSFEPGQSVVIAPEAEKLQKIATELAARPALSLEIEGPFDPKVDTAVMKRAKLDALIAARRDAPGTGEPPSLDSILEGLYAQAFSADRLAEERAKFTTNPPAPPPPPRHVWQLKKTSPPPPPPPIFDGNGFYDAIRAQLVEAQAITADDLRALGKARAAAIAAALTTGGTLTPDRVRALDPAESKKSVPAKVTAEMKLSAKGTAAGETDD